MSLSYLLHPSIHLKLLDLLLVYCILIHQLPFTLRVARDMAIVAVVVLLRLDLVHYVQLTIAVSVARFVAH